jgi:hypothetical protein
VAQAITGSRATVSILTIPVYADPDKAFRSAYVSGMREDELGKQIRTISDDYLAALSAEDWSDGLGELARRENDRRATQVNSGFFARLLGRLGGRAQA